MSVVILLLLNGLFLAIVLAILLVISFRNGHKTHKVHEDIRKIKDKIVE